MNALPFTILCIFILTSGVMRAATQILTPDGVTPSSENGQAPGINLINGTGIVGYGGQTSVEMTSIHEGVAGLGWASSSLSNDPNPTLTYDWGKAQEVCGLVLWQGVGNVGVKDFELRAEDASGNNLGTWTFSATEVPDGAGTIVDVSPQFFPIGSEDMPLTDVSKIVLTVVNNHGGPYVSLSETHFAKPSDEPQEGEICLVDDRSTAQWFVPDTATDQDSWFQPSFDTANWSSGLACLGYELVALDELCQDLIVYLTMDAARVSGASVLDTSASPIIHNGTRQAGVQLVSGQILEGLEAPGNTQSFIEVAHHAELNPEDQDYSVALWVQPKNANATLGIIAQKFGVNSQGSENGWSIVAFGTASTRVELQLSPGVTRTVTMPGLPANVWTHIGFVIDRTTHQMTAYLNGAPVGTANLLASDFISNLDPLFLMNTPNAVEVNYAAVVDDFAVWKRPLSGGDMQAVYNEGVAGNSFKTSGGGAAGLYNALIDTNVGAEMFGSNATVWERIKFNVGSLSGIQAMNLKMHYDDGFICYLNGFEIARRNVPTFTGSPPYNLAAASDRADALALTQEIINVDSHINLLQTGENVLAFHALNSSTTAERFVIWPELCINRVDCREQNKGGEFWLTFPEGSKADPSNLKEISLCLAGAPGTGVLVQMPRLGISIPATIGASGTVKVQLNPDLAELSGSDVIEDKGIHVTAEKAVCVVGLNHINFSTDAYLGLPTKLLGTEYIVLAYPNNGSGVSTLNGTQFGLVATADGTTVQIIPSVTTDGHVAGDPYYITLDAGQTYQLMNVDDGAGDLTGTVIRSTQPVSVFGGHRCANIQGNQFFCDHIVEHLPPVNHWQSIYVMGPLATRTGGDTLRVLAAYDSTDVLFNGVLQTTLNRGEVHDVIVTGPTAITTNNRPVLVGQYSNSSDFDGVEDADPFMALVPPLGGYDTFYRICAPPTGGFDDNYLNITLAAGTEGATTVDGVALLGIAGATFTPIPATALVHAVVPVSASVPHDVLGPEPFGVIAYGFASYNYDSYGFPAGVSFPDLPPQVTTPLEYTVYSDAQSGTAAVPNIQGSSTLEDDCEPVGSLQPSQNPSASTQLGPGTYLITVSTLDSGGLEGVGTTLLHVLSPWQKVYFPNDYPNPETEATVWGCFADGDGDGDSNQDEWLHGGDPSDPNSRAIRELLQGPDAVAGTGLRMRYLRRHNDPAATYEEQGSDNLVNWFSGAGITRTISSTVIYPGAEFEEVIIEALPSLGDPASPAAEKYFLRVVGIGCPQ